MAGVHTGYVRFPRRSTSSRSVSGCRFVVSKDVVNRASTARSSVFAASLRPLPFTVSWVPFAPPADLSILRTRPLTSRLRVTSFLLPTLRRYHGPSDFSCRAAFVSYLRAPEAPATLAVVLAGDSSPLPRVSCSRGSRDLPASRTRPSRPFRLQPPDAPRRRFRTLPLSATGSPVSRVWASPTVRRLATTSGRIEFVILQTGRSPPSAPHATSR